MKFKKISVFYLFGFFLLLGGYYFFNPSEKSWYLPCFFYEITGYQCPGCGTQRALHELLHFNFVNAFKQNALFILSIPYIFAATFFNARKDKYPKVNELLLANKTLLVLLVIAIFFGVLRNL